MSLAVSRLTAGPSRLGLVIALALLLLDQLSKAVVLASADALVPGIVVTPFFNLVLVWNRGVSFGIFNTASAAAPYVLSALALLVVILLLVWLTRTPNRLVTLGLGLVIGGALGNVIDRLRFGAVIDFLDFHAFGWHWPAFNFADSGIVVGAGILLLDGLLADRRRTT